MKIWISIIMLIILTLLFRYYAGTSRDYTKNRDRVLAEIEQSENLIISEEDLESMPVLIANYLRYVGVIGKKKIASFEIDFDGEMKLDQDKEWAKIKAEQTTSLDQSTRLFYMTMKYNGLVLNGLHHYEDGKASMVIKVLDLFKVVDNRGPDMDIAETVTYFNDICVFAPSALLNADIVWEDIDEKSIKGTFTNEGISVSATLYFDDEGKLVNFISNDRFAIDDNGKIIQVPWSTPIESYSEYHGYKLISKGQAIWHYPEGNFSYIRLSVNDVSY